jgi:hypothetical protein
MSLLCLSNELIIVITDIIHPSTIVNFALTCHRIHGCASGSLALHRSRQRELKAQHDRHPMTILKLLRIASISPALLWYIRVLEFYGGRSSWKQWRTYPDYTQMKDEPKVNLTSSGPDLLSDLDLENFHEKNGLRSFVQDSMVRIKSGDDQPLKMILIACCPSLEKVTWVAHEPDPPPNQPYSLLCDLTSAYQPLPHSLWPPGLLSLRSISLGACTEHVHPHENLHPNLTDFCRLLLLPNLKSLRINVAGYDYSDLEYMNAHVPARSSSVEEITINICDFDKSTIIAILQRLRSLKSYLEIYLGHWTSIVDDIRPLFGDTLEELRPQGSNDWKLRLYGDISALSGFPKLRVFTIYVGDLIAENITDKLLPAIGKGKKVKWHDFYAVLPPAAEDIILQWPPRDYYQQLTKHRLHKTLFPDFFEHLDEYVGRQGKNNGGSLKKICLDFVHNTELVRNLGKTESDEFLRLVEEWRKRWGEVGVEAVMHDSRDGVDDEVLECGPTALEWDSDRERNNNSD